MKIRELLEPSPTCDTRARVVPPRAPQSSGLPTTSVDADLQSAAEDLRRSGNSTLVVLDGGGFVGLVTVRDLIRGALAEDDLQLCNDLGEQLLRVAQKDPDATR